MGCRKLTYYDQDALESKANFSIGALEKTMPRSISCLNASPYGFNGMEKDNELKGDGNHYTSEWRQYDSRFGRFMSLDPAMIKYANWSPYSFSFNNPVWWNDPNGNDPEEPEVTTNRTTELSFHYTDKEKNEGKDVIREIETKTTTQRDEDGVILYQMTEINTTTVEVDSEGNISTYQSSNTTIMTNQRVGVRTHNYSSTTKKVGLSSVRPRLKNLASDALEFRRTHDNMSAHQYIAMRNRKESESYMFPGAADVGIMGASAYIPKLFSVPLALFGVGAEAAGRTRAIFLEEDPERVKATIKNL